MDTSVHARLVREIDKAILTGQISQENFFQLTESSGVPKVDAIRIWNGATCGTLDDNVLDRLLDSLCGYQGLVEEYLQSLPPDRQKVNKTVLRRTQLASRQLFGKEFVSLAPEELVAVFSSMGILARSNLSLYSNVIKKFAEWCLEQRRAFPICDILNRPEVLKTKNVPVARTAMTELMGREELDQILRTTFADSGNNTGCVLCILVFLGIPLEEAIRLKDEEVKLSAEHLVIRDKRYPVSMEWLAMIQRYRMTKEYSTQQLRFYARRSSYLLKPYAVQDIALDEPIGTSGAKQQLQKVAALYLEKTGKQKTITETSLLRSGWFDTALRMEQEDVKINADVMQMVTGRSKAVAFNLLKMYKDYKKVYG